MHGLYFRISAPPRFSSFRALISVVSISGYPPLPTTQTIVAFLPGLRRRIIYVSDLQKRSWNVPTWILSFWARFTSLMFNEQMFKGGTRTVAHKLVLRLSLTGPNGICTTANSAPRLNICPQKSRACEVLCCAIVIQLQHSSSLQLSLHPGRSHVSQPSLLSLATSQAPASIGGRY